MPRVRIVGGVTRLVHASAVVITKNVVITIFIMKIYIHAILSNYTKILNREYLELYSTMNRP